MHIHRRAFIKLMAKGATLSSFVPFVLKSRKVSGQHLARSRGVLSRDEAATDGSNIDPSVVGEMLRRAINAFTDGKGWRALFPTYVPGERIGIKISTINPDVSESGSQL